MQFSAIFPGWFITTDPWKPKGSLSVLDDFSLDYPKLRRYFSFERLLKYQNRILYLVCRNSAIQEVTIYLKPVLVTSTPIKSRGPD